MHRMIPHTGLDLSDPLQEGSGPTVHVTDTTPHIVWTDQYKFVILELMTDGSLLLFTTNEDVIKVPAHHYQRPEFDFRDHLLDKSHVRLDPSMYKHDMRVAPTDYVHTPSARYHQTAGDVLEEFDNAYLRTTHPRPPAQILKRRPRDKRSDLREKSFMFWNFSLPNIEFYDCWYHSSNVWTVNKPDKFYSVCPDIHIQPHEDEDDTFPNNYIMITCPAPHRCGLNRHLYFELEDVSQLKFMCPDKEIVSGYPLGTTMRQVPIEGALFCKIFYSYQATPWDTQFSLPEMYRFLTDIVIFRHRIWNLPFYRCRLDHDNRSSRFWKDKQLTTRLLEVREHPEPAKYEQQIAQMKEAQQFSKVCTRIPFTWYYDKGLHYLNTVIISQPGDNTYLDPSKLSVLPYKWVDDMDARGRGFHFYYKHYNLVVFRNVLAANLYVIGNTYTNVYIDVLHNGTEVTHAWRRYRSPIRPTLKDPNADFRPLLKTLETERAPHECIPWTTREVFRQGDLPLRPRLDDPLEWTPIIMPCDMHKCTPPANVYEYSNRRGPAVTDYIQGIKRSYTVTNDYLNSLIKHAIPNKCYTDHSTDWKIAKDGPITFLICGKLVSERGHVDFYAYQKRVIGMSVPSEKLEFITYSPTFGLCTLMRQFVRIESDPERVTIVGPDEPETLPVPTWTCGPGCVPPARILKFVSGNSPEYKAWLINLSLNADKIKYQYSTSISEPCTVNPEATWRMYFRDGFGAYLCSNYSLLGINYHLPLHHPMRWTMAYQFAKSELDQLPWQTPTDYDIAHLPGVYVTRLNSQSPFYRVTRYPTNDFCDYSLLRFGIGMPVQHEVAPELVIYEDAFEADILVVTKLLKQFRFARHVAPTPEHMALRFLAQFDTQQLHTEQKVIRNATGTDPIPGTDDYQATVNEIADLIGSDLALEIQEKKPVGSDADVLGAAALPHDTSSSMENHRGVGRFFHKRHKQDKK